MAAVVRLRSAIGTAKHLYYDYAPAAAGCAGALPFSEKKIR